MIWNKELDKRFPTVVGRDHPFSLGYEMKLVTTSPYADKPYRVSAKEMLTILPKQYQKSEGLHAVWDDPVRRVVIVINFASQADWSKKRVIELLAHELSHAVDDIFKRCAMTQIDTELRAYTLDWLVGKYLCVFPVIGK